MTQPYLLACLNLAVCTFCFWVALCRINHTTASTPRLTRYAYAGMLVGSVSSGLSPMLWGEWPGVGSISMALCVAAMCLCPFTTRPLRARPSA